ncbi:hypothetical protein [uncultured Tateyamaria sp.]|uniref:hypothetical protein n=1 Tax=uncultured Tateyamaria sp. TaxID=455651 RepID=UPI0026203E62|nr:hypothetical protein [uncultured Tateyamaria sp.]
MPEVGGSVADEGLMRERPGAERTSGRVTMMSVPLINVRALSKSGTCNTTRRLRFIFAKR